MEICIHITFSVGNVVIVLVYIYVVTLLTLRRWTGGVARSANMLPCTAVK